MDHIEQDADLFRSFPIRFEGCLFEFFRVALEYVPDLTLLKAGSCSRTPRLMIKPVLQSLRVEFLDFME